MSDAGRVRSEDRVTEYPDGSFRHFKGRVLALNLNSDGYPHVRLSYNKRGETYRTHILVLAAFVGPRPEGMEEVRHLDGDSTNDRLENLVYGTRSENQNDSVRHGTHHLSRLTECLRGHEFSAENTYYTPGTRRRQCRSCARIRAGRREFTKLELKELSGHP